MKLSSQIKPITYLKANAAKIVRSLGEERNPLVITQNGEAKAVSMRPVEPFPGGLAVTSTNTFVTRRPVRLV